MIDLFILVRTGKLKLGCFCNVVLRAANDKSRKQSYIYISTCFEVQEQQLFP